MTNKNITDNDVYTVEQIDNLVAQLLEEKKRILGIKEEETEENEEDEESDDETSKYYASINYQMNGNEHELTICADEDSLFIAIGNLLKKLVDENRLDIEALMLLVALIHLEKKEKEKEGKK